MMNASGTTRVFENLRQEDREISDTIVRLPRVARTIFFCSDYGRPVSIVLGPASSSSELGQAILPTTTAMNPRKIWILVQVSSTIHVLTDRFTAASLRYKSYWID